MHKSNKFAWSWLVKEECLEEYVKMHLEPWPEIMEAHRKAGIKNYSIFQNGRQFFYCFECDDVEKAFKYIDNDESCQRWNTLTSQMVEEGFDFSKDEPIKQLKEIFFLR